MKTDLSKLEELYPEMPSIPSDIEISQNAVMKPIAEISQLLGVKSDDLEQYGKYKAKIEDEVWENVKDNPDGKLILVTAITPTPAGEGKTCTSIGLAQAFGQLGVKHALALREPSMGRHLASKEVLQVAVIPRFCLWKILTCTLPVIFMQLQLHIIYCLPFWTTQCTSTTR